MECELNEKVKMKNGNYGTDRTDGTHDAGVACCVLRFVRAKAAWDCRGKARPPRHRMSGAQSKIGGVWKELGLGTKFLRFIAPFAEIFLF